MYERMLNKQVMPTIEEMTNYCGKCGEYFILLNEWITESYGTEQQIVFPYGNQYGWGISHKRKKKLICNVFAEVNAFTVMIRVSEKQCQAIYEQIGEYAKEYLDNKYPCSDGGWIHYRILGEKHLYDIKKIISEKCS